MWHHWISISDWSYLGIQPLRSLAVSIRFVVIWVFTLCAHWLSMLCRSYRRERIGLFLDICILSEIVSECTGFGLSQVQPNIHSVNAHDLFCQVGVFNEYPLLVHLLSQWVSSYPRIHPLRSLTASVRLKLYKYTDTVLWLSMSGYSYLWIHTVFSYRQCWVIYWNMVCVHLQSISGWSYLCIRFLCSVTVYDRLKIYMSTPCAFTACVYHCRHISSHVACFQTMVCLLQLSSSFHKTNKAITYPSLAKSAHIFIIVLLNSNSLHMKFWEFSLVAELNIYRISLMCVAPTHFGRSLCFGARLKE